MTISLVLADDQPLHLLGLQHLLSTQPVFRIAASCTDGDDALRAVREHRPDILLLDLYMPGKDGLSVLREMHAEQLDVKVVILTAYLDEDSALEAVRLGVRGVVLKKMPPEMLIQCLLKVHAGGEWLEKQSMSRMLEKLLRREAQTERISALLTSRETEMLRLTVQGLSNREIADRLFISEGTVKVHLHRVYSKLQVKSRVGLTLLAKEIGWI